MGETEGLTVPLDFFMVLLVGLTWEEADSGIAFPLESSACLHGMGLFFSALRFLLFFPTIKSNRKIKTITISIISHEYEVADSCL